MVTRSDRDPLSGISTRETSQTQSAREDQVPNSAGGYVWQVDDHARALRFLILGTTGGTYYIGEKDLTKQNADVIIKLAASDGEWLVHTLREVSLEGRAPKQNPTLFALAACTASPDVATRKAAVQAIRDVCRTGTHLFIFARYVEQFRGWGRGLRNAIADWYTNKPASDVAFQAVKYRQREGWSHRDLVRLSHPKTTPGSPHQRILDWVLHETVEFSQTPEARIITGFRTAQLATHPRTWAELVSEYRLPWEALPDAALDSPEVWEAMLPHIGFTALIRQLGRLSRIGYVTPFSTGAKAVVEKLADGDGIKRARVHPFNVLVAMATYASGHGFKGKTEWEPVPQVVGALDEAFYASFGNVIPANKKTLLALDVSGSMGGWNIMNSPLTPREASAAMAMVTVRTEPEYHTMAFGHQFVPLALTPNMRLDTVVQATSSIPFGGTDCALPMVWAIENRVPVETFVIYTDNETWAGRVHPFQALRAYRDKLGIPARLIVVGMVSNGFTIADPSDRGMLDVVGFDGAAPELMSAFSRGEV